MSNQKKNETLGMPHGTACHRLRKMILFKLLLKLEENVCVKCHLPIEVVEDLSIEHLKPWEGISAELFWDLDNIAFSHLKCNRPDRPDNGGIKNRFVGPDGTNWCWKHQKFLPVEWFSPNKHRWNGLHNLCKECAHYNR